MRTNCWRVVARRAWLWRTRTESARSRFPRSAPAYIASRWSAPRRSRSQRPESSSRHIPRWRGSPSFVSAKAPTTATRSPFAKLLADEFCVSAGFHSTGNGFEIDQSGPVASFCHQLADQLNRPKLRVAGVKNRRVREKVEHGAVLD